MKPTILLPSLFLLLACTQAARSDMVGPASATRALSPDGNLTVRIETVSSDPKGEEPPTHEVSYYGFDQPTHAYQRCSSFQFKGFLPQMLFVSDSGDLVMISLWHGGNDAIRLYSKKGKLVKSWSLKRVLTKTETKACAMTGATLQWFDEGAFEDRMFYFWGPSLMIRAVQPPFTEMRGADANVSFSGSIDAATGKLTKYEPEKP